MVKLIRVKRCLKCGGKDISFDNISFEKRWYVFLRCRDCLERGEHAKKKSQAVELWNMKQEKGDSYEH